jgi:multidrug efflux pump subunit AcrA (membrane-fusion protein)
MLVLGRSLSRLVKLRRKHSAALLCAVMLLVPAAAAAQNDLARARQLYNQGKFDESIAAAESARSRSKIGLSAGLVIARARLERFRMSGNQQDLSESRKELVALDPRTLSAPEAIEWNIGLGEALVFENQLGPAAEIFGEVLTRTRATLTPAEIEKLIEWWASALSGQAETLAGTARTDKYGALLSMLRTLTDERLPSRAATYWSVVASRGVGDFDTAWNIAVAGWVRAGSMDEGDQLRKDLNKFVTETLIPERAQARTGQPLDLRVTATEKFAITEEWRGLTERWGGGSSQ